MIKESSIYIGKVIHKRFKPKVHFFKYRVFSILLDLSEINLLDKTLKIFSHNKFNIVSFYDADHGARDGTSLNQWVIKNLEDNNINTENIKIKLLCYPRIFGYVFNPLSIFYCYNNKKLKAIFYEVKNTFNEQHTYIFKANGKDKISQNCKKKFYVSPFMNMSTYYNFKLLNPSKKLFISIKQTDKIGKILTAIQTGERKRFNFSQLISNFFKYPLMTLKIITAIHFEALLLWKKGAKYRSRNKKINNNYSYE